MSGTLRFILALALALAALPALAARDFLVDAAWLEAHIDAPDLVLLEVRYHPHRYFTVGHIPGAINIVSLDGTDGQSQKWLPEAQLAALYESIPKDKTVYVYCHDGFRMSLAWMQLRSLGYEDVRLYNGGWSHWGNELTLPTVQGPEPYDAEYAL